MTDRSHFLYPHSTQFSGKGYHRSSKAARGEDLQVEHPVCSGYASAFHLYPTLPGMLRAPLIRDQVIQVRQPREKRLLTAPRMMESLHHEELPLDGVMRLIEQRTTFHRI